MKSINKISGLFVVLAIISCNNNDDTNTEFPKKFKQGTTLPYNVLKKVEDTEIRNGGFGSAACKHPKSSTLFYALTDRGANLKFTGAQGKGKKFPTPEYNPRIGLFELMPNGSIKLKKQIILKNPSGLPLTGLPNPEGKGATGEVPYAMDGNVLTVGPNGNGTDDFGLDSEGLAAMNDGTFWISDEYGPHIVHFDNLGKEMERISPVGINGTEGKKLPAVFARRRANRGMEGLTVTPDQKTLVGIMQSTMYNPSKATKDSNVTRIVTLDIATGKTKQYLYKQEKNQNANSEITALSNTEFLVIERDGKFLADDPMVQKHIYKINISGATDISYQNGKDLFNDPNGYMINQKTIEESMASEIEATGVKFVTKTLAVDLVKAVNYPHDKLEGIWLIGNGKIGCINDDDFAVWSENGKLIQKKLSPTTKGKTDASSLYILEY